MALQPASTILPSIATTSSEAGGRQTDSVLRCPTTHSFRRSANLADVPARHPLAAVLFDWDGTLIDSYHADSQAYLGMFRELGLGWGLKELESSLFAGLV